jgi:(2Fe-2S) ferredoxin
MEFQQQFEARGIWGRFGLTSAGCLGPCGNGPSVLVYPEGVLYGSVRVDDVCAIIDEHLIGGAPVARLKVPEEFWG